MKKHKIYFLFIIGTAIFLFNVVVFDLGLFNSRKMPKDFDYGSWYGSTYKNDFFGFSITLPQDWHIVGDEEYKVRMQVMLDADFVDKDKMKKIVKNTDITTAKLICANRYTEEEAMEKEDFNSNFLLMSENLSHDRKKYDLAEYVKVYHQKIGRAVRGVTVISESRKMIGGREFASMKISLEIHDGITLYQEHLIHVKNDFALLFFLGWLNDSDKEQLDAIMDTLKWD